MGRRSKVKGYGYERDIVNWHRSVGCEAERVPLSGAAKGSYGADIRLGPTLAYSGECKRFKTGLAKLYDAIEQDQADLVFARADRKQTLVCMTIETWEDLLEKLGWAHKRMGQG